jgi:PAS domain S-box-containing protein
MTKPDFEQILQSCNHGVIATDKQGKIVFINKRAKEILQFGRKKIVGVHISRLLPMTAELVADCLKSGNSQLGSQVLTTINQ